MQLTTETAHVDNHYTVGCCNYMLRQAFNLRTQSIRSLPANGICHQRIRPEIYCSCCTLLAASISCYSASISTLAIMCCLALPCGMCGQQCLNWD